MKIALPAAAALTLAACAQDQGTAADDPATANLTINSSPTAAEQAINRTDQQSELGNAADEAADSISNSVQ